jgi:hypothetical protein
LKRLEATNVFTACVVIAVFVALGSPVADPARISVNDQVARLEAGLISPDQFDFAFLRFRSARFGHAALDRLKAKADGPNAAQIARKVSDALAWTSPWEASRKVTRLTPEDRAANVRVVYPSGGKLPDSFLQQDWNAKTIGWNLPSCLISAVTCEAVVADVDGDGAPEVLIFGGVTANGTAFKLGADQTWTVLGPVYNANCNGVPEALRRGEVQVVAPGLKELLVSGQHLRIQPNGCNK